MQIDSQQLADIARSMEQTLGAREHSWQVHTGAEAVPGHLSFTTVSSALEEALRQNGIVVAEPGARGQGESTEGEEAFERMLDDAENDLRLEGQSIFRITHHYDIGNQDVYVEDPTGEVDGRRVALYLWFKACEWFGYAKLISNLGIASVMVTSYGFRHCAVHPFPTTVDLYADAEGFAGYEELMSDAALHRDGLKEALAPHVE